MHPLQLLDPASGTCTYLLHDPHTREALIIDPVDAQIERDLAVLQARGLRLCWAVETHNHADHITSAALLAEHTGARTAAPAACGIGTAQVQLADGDVLHFGGEELRALHTPGHTAGSMSYLWRGHVFTGDTLLIGSCGRTDFQSGNARTLWRSITQVLLRAAARHPGLAGARLRGAQPLQHCRRAGAQPAPGRAYRGAVCRADARTAPARARAHARDPAGQPPLGPAPRCRRSRRAGPGTQRPRLCGRREPGPGLAMGAAGQAVLVDVRTDAERAWVGEVPGAVAVAWKQWPGMALNPQFDAQIQAAVPPGRKALLLCRSGVRSIAAAQRATALGLEAWNVLEGFEGDPDEHAHRGRVGGWRFHGLPWRQG
jgi:sulfur dioxygenase